MPSACGPFNSCLVSYWKVNPIAGQASAAGSNAQTSGRANPILTGVFRTLSTMRNANVIFCQLLPWRFDPRESMNLKRTFRRLSYLVSRLAANLGAAAATPVLGRFASPANAGKRRWLDGLYLDVPEEWDDPYRFFRW